MTMTHWHALLIASMTWLLWIPAAILDKKTSGDMGRISAFPVIPLFPALAWELAYKVDLAFPQWGTILVVSAHLLLMVYMLFSLAKSLFILHSN